MTTRGRRPPWCGHQYRQRGGDGDGGGGDQCAGGGRAPAAEAAERSFVGRWRGAYENRDGRCEIDLDIRVQDGEAVRGQFTSSQGPWRDDLGNTGTFRITNLVNQLAAINAGD